MEGLGHGLGSICGGKFNYAEDLGLGPFWRLDFRGRCGFHEYFSLQFSCPFVNTVTALV